MAEAAQETEQVIGRPSRAFNFFGTVSPLWGFHAGSPDTPGLTPWATVLRSFGATGKKTLVRNPG